MLKVLSTVRPIYDNYSFSLTSSGPLETNIINTNDESTFN